MMLFVLFLGSVCAAAMKSDDSAAFQKLLSNAFFGTSHERRYGLPGSLSNCPTRGFNPTNTFGGHVQCDFSGYITHLSLQGGRLNFDFGSMTRSIFQDMDRLEEIYIDGFGVRGSLPANKDNLFGFNNRVKTFVLTNSNAVGPMPPWFFDSVMTEVKLLGNNLMDRQLPLDLPGSVLPTKCEFEEGFFDCPIPAWIEPCLTNRSTCYTPTSAPTPVPTPPTAAPTPQPTPDASGPWAELIPCPPVENSTVHGVAECGQASVECQFPCVLHTCSAAYDASSIEDLFAPDEAWNCFKTIGLPDCEPRADDCRSAWAPPGAGDNYLDLVFGDKTEPLAVVVYQNYDPGFVSSIELYDEENSVWAVGWAGTDGNRTRGDLRRLKRFPLAGITFESNRVRINMTAVSERDEVDTVMLIGSTVTLPPTPAPTPAPTPPPCLPVVQLGRSSAQDSTLGDEFCLAPSACQWACRVLACSGEFNAGTYACSNVVGYNRNTVWNAPAVGSDEAIELLYDIGMRPTHVLVIEDQIGGGVVGIDLWDDSTETYKEVYAGAIRTIANMGVEVYELDTNDFDRSLYVTRVRVRFDGYRFHDVAAIRLVGEPDPTMHEAVPTPRPVRPPPRRLPGIFIKTETRMKAARFGMLAQHNPAAVVDDIVYVAPGSYLDRGFLSAVNEFDRCNLTSEVCANHKGQFDKKPNFGKLRSTAQAATKVGSARVWAIAGGRETVDRKYNGNVFLRSDDDPNWVVVELVTPRIETSMVSPPNEEAIYLGGGLRSSDNVFPAYRDTIERISFPSGTVESAQSNEVAVRLSSARAEIGIAVAGVQKDKIVFAGGRGYNDKNSVVASNLVDIFDTKTQTIKTTSMREKASAVSVASVASLVFITGGAPTYGPPTNGAAEGQVDYGAYNRLAVEQYDMDSGEWQYIDFVLTALIHDDIVPDRVAVPLADRFIAVVAGQFVVNYSGREDMSRQNESSHRRVVDLFDTATNTWHNDVLPPHHAGGNFQVAAAGNKLAVFGGSFAPDGDAFSAKFDTVTVFEWKPYPYTLIDCAVNTDCQSCLYTNQDRNYEECRWCADPNDKASGVCIEKVRPCAVVPFTSVLIAPTAVCITPAPTPTPLVTFDRKFQLTVDADFDKFDTKDFIVRLAKVLEVPSEDIVEFAPARRGSVIMFLHHRAATQILGPEAARLDAAWLAAVDTPSLEIASLERKDDSFQPSVLATPMPAPGTTTVVTTAPEETPTATSGRGGEPVVGEPADGDATLFIIVGIAAGVIVCLMCGLVLWALLSRKKKGPPLEPFHTKPMEDPNTIALDYPQQSVTPTIEISTRHTLSGTATIDAKYLILSRDIERGKKLGEGAFGVVFKGRWRNIDVAVKEVKAEAMSDPAQIESFEQEAVKMSQLRPHENCVTLYGICQSPLSIVTQFCVGGALDDWLHSPEGQDATTLTLLTIVSGAAKGVAHLHAEGIIHRDLAARNILLAEGLRPKVADFGMSRNQEGEESNETRTRVGPLKWMAPEQLLTPSYSRASDVFSFGVVIYETMSGREPWEGIVNTAACHRVLQGERVPVPARAPEALGDVMRLCFETEPSERPTMDDMCRRLDRIVEEEGHDKKAARKSKRKSKKVAMQDDYDEPTGSVASTTYGTGPPPSGSSVAPSSVAQSVADSYMAPSVRSEDAYQLAPPLSEASLRMKNQYSEPSIVGGTTAELGRVDPTVAAMSDKEQARLWRLSKKYEPKDAPGTMEMANAPASEDPLPEGWRQAISPKSGRTYYYQKGVTGSTTWVRPTAPLPSANQVAPDSAYDVPSSNQVASESAYDVPSSNQVASESAYDVPSSNQVASESPYDVPN